MREPGCALGVSSRPSPRARFPSAGIIFDTDEAPFEPADHYHCGHAHHGLLAFLRAKDPHATRQLLITRVCRAFREFKSRGSPFQGGGLRWFARRLGPPETCLAQIVVRLNDREPSARHISLKRDSRADWEVQPVPRRRTPRPCSSLMAPLPFSGDGGHEAQHRV